MIKPSRTPRRTNLKRNAILESATQAFGAHGYESANVDVISDVAGVSKRTVYKQFGNKEGLFLAVLQSLMEGLAALQSDRPFSSEPLRSQLFDFARAKTAAMASDPSWNALMRIILSAFVQNPAMARRTLQTLQRDDEWLCGWLEAAHASGRLRIPDPQLTARLFWATIWGAVLWPRVIGTQGDNASEDATIGEIVELFIHRHAPTTKVS
jgi:TetR/AcrR family transcriptional regulator, regulator of autoinduction and epiphytic fitness